MVEDDPDILWTNKSMFVSQGYAVVTAESLLEARVRLDETPPDVIVLDVMLPDGNGLDFIPEIRKITTAPILMLTALSEKDNRLAGLLAGGDDYISKPYDIDELCAKVAAFLRRDEMLSQKPPADTFMHGPITLDIMANQAYINGESMELSVKEFSLLHFFVKNEGKILTKEALYEAIWKQELCGDDRAVRIAVSRLRKKLETSNCEYDILGARSEGYVFIEA